MKVWVVVDICCLECGGQSKVKGIFRTEAEAVDAVGEVDSYFDGSEHSVEVFESEVPWIE